MKVWMIRSGGFNGNLLDIVTSDEGCERTEVLKTWKESRGMYFDSYFPAEAVICFHVEDKYEKYKG